jgi:ABC transporter substrate binding protein
VRTATSSDLPYAEAGLLASYGIDQRESYRRGASYVDRILKGAKAGDLPIEFPTRIELTINLNKQSVPGRLGQGRSTPPPSSGSCSAGTLGCLLSLPNRTRTHSIAHTNRTPDKFAGCVGARAILSCYGT